MTQLRPDTLSADARVNATGAIEWSAGNIVNVVRTGIGVYEIALREALSPSQCTVFVTALGADLIKRSLSLEWTSTTLLRIRAVGV